MASSILKQHLARFDSGERFPALLNPDWPAAFLPNMYLVAKRRPRNVASNTLRRDGRSIMHLYAWACTEAIDIEERFEAGRFLTLIEVESLTRACHLRDQTLTASLEKGKTHPSRRIIPMPGTSQVDSRTAYTHMNVIMDYLDWLAIRAIHRLPESRKDDYRMLNQWLETMRLQIRSRQPMVCGRNVVGAREGLSKDERKLLLDVVSPLGWSTCELPPDVADWHWSKQNPWKRHSVRVRNFLIVQTLLHLGIRAGELLGIKVGHIKSGKGNTHHPYSTDTG